MRLANRNAVVTGSARGIGFSIARRLCEEGASVLIADKQRPAAAAQRLREAGFQAEGFEVDITDQSQVWRLFDHVETASGRLDILVNNAGVGLNRPFLETSAEEWERTLRVNLTGTFYCAQAAAKLMAAHGGGAIVNISSISGVRGAQNRSAYGASKAGVILLTRVMALELAPLNIRVNTVAPGPVATEMTSVTHPPAIRQSYHSRIPMKRYAQAEEIAAAVAFLASADASFINGHTLHVDGGFTASGLMFDPSS